MRRTTIGGVLGMVALVALGLAAVVRPPDMVVTLLATLAVFFIAGLIALIWPGRAPGWTGFAILGWAYFLVMFATPEWTSARLPATHWLEKLAESIHAPGLPPPTLDNPIRRSRGLDATPRTISDDARHTARSSYIRALVAYNQKGFASIAVGHCLVGLLLGLLGAVAGRAVAARGRAEPSSPGR